MQLKEYSDIILNFDYSSKLGVFRLKTISGTTIAKAGGCGYNKKNECFNVFFKKLGFDIDFNKISFSFFNLKEVNDFLKKNNVNYYIFYANQVNSYIDLLHFKKIN